MTTPAVYIEPILCSDTLSRREAEQQASLTLAQRIAGPDAVIEHYSDGAPYIPGFSGHISLTHCSPLAAIAVSSSPHIGIDAEIWRPQLQRIAHKFLSPAQIPYWSASLLRLLFAWTIKEAVYKAARTPGLPLHNITLPSPATLSALNSPSTPLISSTPDSRQWRISVIATSPVFITVVNKI